MRDVVRNHGEAVDECIAQPGIGNAQLPNEYGEIERDDRDDGKRDG
jgi:hypothetical protein